MKKAIILMGVTFAAFMLFTGFSVAAGPETGEAGKTQSNIMLGCAIAVGISGISAATGLAISGSAAVAVTGEKPDLFGSVLVLQVLPMTQSVYGLLTAILMMMGAGLLGGNASADLANSTLGWGGIAIGVVVGLTSISAIGQGMVASASIAAVGRNREVAARGILFTVTTETMAIFGLLVGILLMTGLGLL